MNELRRRAATAALLLLPLAAACTNAAAGSGNPLPTDTPAVETPVIDEPAAPAPVHVDWSGPTVEPTDLPGGWVLAVCEGGAPLLCVTDGDRLVGTVSSGRWAPDAPITDPATFLRGELDDHLEIFASDRAAACGDGYRYALDGPARHVTVDGAPGLQYAVVGTDAEGVVHERSLTTTVVAGDEVVWIAAVGTSPDGCMAGDAPGEFTPADLVAFTPWYEAMIAGSSFGEGGGDAAETPIADGDHAGRIRFEDGAVFIETVEVLTGEAAREAAVETGVIEEGQDLPNDVFVDVRGTTSWSLPLDPNTTAAVYDCSSGCELVEVEIADLSSGAAGAFNGEAAIFELTVLDGRVTALEEIYLP